MVGCIPNVRYVRGQRGEGVASQEPIALFLVAPAVAKIKEVMVGSAVLVHLGGVAINQGSIGVQVKGSYDFF